MFTLFAMRGREFKVMHGLLLGEAPAWIDDLKTHGWQVSVKDTVTGDMVSREDLVRIWHLF
jgi:hypothetical protein